MHGLSTKIHLSATRPEVHRQSRAQNSRSHAKAARGVSLGFDSSSELAPPREAAQGSGARRRGTRQATRQGGAASSQPGERLAHALLLEEQQQREAEASVVAAAEQGAREQQQQREQPEGRLGNPEGDRQRRRRGGGGNRVQRVEASHRHAPLDTSEEQERVKRGDKAVLVARRRRSGAPDADTAPLPRSLAARSPVATALRVALCLAL
eukprot:CAMPEP_0196683414 /NCGR_PEP_ID=MMETSP1090-20130531/9892_1 /TAXON_ID=37098 /ORGANISM="Isochrysis sp, Strain CCMP1244" /LENGTH=208 /DNA_ID=CAMNT_0042021855 /DNA_START=100 /DNA_END=723 /DNA_ORIENTATION=+